MLDTPARANERNTAPQGTPIAGTSKVFLGDQDNPLLAPRGVHLADGHLIIADTGQNRVFIWNSLPGSTYHSPDVVLGQLEKTSTERNAGGKVSGSSLMYPSGLWSDGRRLVVADAWNHRVLIWNTMPTTDGQEADLVIGQRDFTGNDPNVAGIGAPPSAQSLNWPYGVTSDGERLFIADTGNRRVLVYDQFPTTSFAAADRVIGKTGFDDRDYDHNNAIWPYSVKLGPGGELAITDTQYYRVLLWQKWEDALEQPAQRIFGQQTLADNGQNQFRWFPEAFTLNWCYDTCFHRNGLLIADTGNSRVLWYSGWPEANSPAAESLLGQENFQVGIENRNSITATPESMYWPFHLDVEDGTLAVADTGNHRVILHKLTD